MNIIKKVVISEEHCNYVQRLYYIWEGYKVLMTSIMRDKESKYCQERIDQTMKEYHQSFAAYNTSLDYIKQIYGPTLDPLKVGVEIAFNDNVVKFVELSQEKGGGCCGNKKE